MHSNDALFPPKTQRTEVHPSDFLRNYSIDMASSYQIAEDNCWPHGFISGKLFAHFLHHLRKVAPLRISHTQLWLRIGSACVFSLSGYAVWLTETFIYDLKNEILTWLETSQKQRESVWLITPKKSSEESGLCSWMLTIMPTRFSGILCLWWPSSGVSCSLPVLSYAPLPHVCWRSPGKVLGIKTDWDNSQSHAISHSVYENPLPKVENTKRPKQRAEQIQGAKSVAYFRLIYKNSLDNRQGSLFSKARRKVFHVNLDRSGLY